MKGAKIILVLFSIIVLLIGGCSNATTEGNIKEHTITKEGNWTSIDDELFVINGDDGINMVLITSDDEAILLDLSSDEQAVTQVKDYLTENKLTLKNIIYTHSYKRNQKNLVQLKTENVELILPTKVEDKTEITLGDNSFKLIVTEAYGDKSQISIEYGDILIAGNIISTLEDKPTTNTYSDFDKMINTLESLKDKNYSYIIPAYGEITEDKEIIKNQLELLKADYNNSKNRIVEEEKWTIIDDDIFISMGNKFDVNMTLVVSGNEATLIDAGKSEEEAIRIKEYIEREKLTLKNIIITHGHSDHISNLEMFRQENVEVYDIFNTVDNQVITMGDKTMTILHTPGHYNDEHLSVEINDDILVAGDIITSFFDPTSNTLQNSLEHLHPTLQKLKNNNYNIIIPGHGKVSTNDTIIREHIFIVEKYK